MPSYLPTLTVKISYSSIHLSQDIKPNKELRRKAPQLFIGFDFCPNITDYSYKITLSSSA
ncbi:hypothetical protein FEV09_05830 [Pseudanabaena catenata USMAC16]|uniref:Uncharacterized protein n=1 Tax=Pseudanabaena catenata USMAC16 TaxID=1855837 RepID=A0A9X4M728_9CYAN|nr:hypothetical protein [Pseudanabaena catenata]MDG3494074.1 hypothetical protein [Pseudanabaena catenata USMAC16]